MEHKFYKYLIFFCSFICSSSFAAGSFFTITSSGSTITIKPTTTYNYTSAGIKINTEGYTIDNVGTDCTLLSNGYCQFTTSNTSPKELTISGTGGSNYSITACLNSDGPIECQNTTIFYPISISTLVSTITGPDTQSQTLSVPASISSDATLSLTFQGDLGSSFETIDVQIDGTTIATIGGTSGPDCALETTTISIPKATLEPLITDGEITISFTSNNQVNNFCSGTGVFSGLTNVAYAVQGALGYST